MAPSAEWPAVGGEGCSVESMLDLIQDLTRVGVESFIAPSAYGAEGAMKVCVMKLRP